MGKRGPAKTPTKVLELRGSWRAKLPDRAEEIKLPTLDTPPDPPEWLTEKGKTQFRLIVGDVHASGMLCQVDIGVLGALAERITQYCELRDNPITTHPMLVNEGVARKNPAVTLRDEALRDVLRLWQQLGMTPASRIAMPKPEKIHPKTGQIIDTKGLFAKG